MCCCSFFFFANVGLYCDINKYSQRKRSVKVVRQPGESQKVGMLGTKGNLTGVFRVVVDFGLFQSFSAAAGEISF